MVPANGPMRKRRRMRAMGGRRDGGAVSRPDVHDADVWGPHRARSPPFARRPPPRRIGQPGKASRAICESHRQPDPKPALANLRGKQIVNFGEEPPLTCGKRMENQNAQQN